MFCCWLFSAIWRAKSCLIRHHQMLQYIGQNMQVISFQGKNQIYRLFSQRKQHMVDISNSYNPLESRQNKNNHYLKSGLNPDTAISLGQHGLLLSRRKGSVVPCANTFRDKHLLDGSQSREHKGPPPSFVTTVESMHSAHISLLNIP